MAVLGLGLVLARSTGTTFEGRYAAVMFPLFLAAAAFGITVFSSRTVRYAVLALLLLGGFWGGASNALRNRTQAFEIASPIDRDALPGDLVVYCPDSIGTDVSRLLRDDVREIGLPGFQPPGRIDWTDYSQRVDAIRPIDTMREIAQARRQRSQHLARLHLRLAAGAEEVRPDRRRAGRVPPGPAPDGGARSRTSSSTRACTATSRPGTAVVRTGCPRMTRSGAAPTRPRQPAAEVPGPLRGDPGGRRARAAPPRARAGVPVPARLAHHRAGRDRRASVTSCCSQE